MTVGAAVRLSGLGELADALASWPEASADGERLARVRVADACVAYLSTAASAGPGRPLPAYSAALNAEAIARTLATRIRYSETDDILLESCVTPGSVVVPALFAAASLRPEVSAGRMAAAAAAGYATLALCGGLLGGAVPTGRGGWPTRAAAAIGAAATVSVVLGLDADACRNGLALAAGLTWHGKPGEPAREIVFGWTVEIGVRCALLAAEGAVGDEGTLVRPPWDAPGALTLRPDAIGAARIKPLCSARQALPAITCLLAIIGARGVAPGEITGIDVWLSGPCRAFVDRPRVTTRLDSIASLQYQAAAAVWAPHVLWDVTREELTLLARSQSMAALLRLHEDPVLTGQYPARWPARVTVTSSQGSFTSAEPDHPETGCPDTTADPLGAVREKATRLFPPDTGARRACDTVIARCLTFGNAAGLTEVLERKSDAVTRRPC